MGSGDSLIGYRGDTKIVDMFSGNDTDIDYYLGRLINANSVLVQQKPKHFLD
jgi:hypothetical protein